jgi:hypothetical protein
MSTPRRVPATDVLADSLASSAALSAKTKTVLAKQISKISIELNRADTLPVRRAELVREILEIQQVLNQNVEALGRLLHKPIASAPSDTSTDAVTTESVLQEFISGKRRRGGV